MIVTSVLEPTQISDGETGHPVYVSTSARIMYRKLNPEWARVKNLELNTEIAKQFISTKVEDYFTPKKAAGDAKGQIRSAGSTKFIALDFGNRVAIIAVKGSPKISGLPKQAAMADYANSMKGWFSSRYFDAIKDMYNLDHNSVDALANYLDNLNGTPPHNFKKLTKNMDRDQIIKFINSKNRLIQDSTVPPRLYSVPVGLKY